jgi:hypothetical protein
MFLTETKRLLPGEKFYTGRQYQRNFLLHVANINKKCFKGKGMEHEVTTPTKLLA